MPVRHGGPMLVVEDGDEDFDILCCTLKQLGVHNEIFRCTDGDDALDFLHQRGAHAATAARPLLMIVDLNLPGTDGRELLAALDADTSLRAIPSIVLTTSNNPRDVSLCYGLGANCYAVKPVGLKSLELLLLRIRDFWLDTMELPAC